MANKDKHKKHCGWLIEDVEFTTKEELIQRLEELFADPDKEICWVTVGCAAEWD